MLLRKLVLAVVLLSAARFAHASPATPANMKKAKAHYLQAEAFKSAQQYDKAVTEYKAAYELAPLSDFLFNIGQAYRLQGDKANALDYYHQYLEADPDGRGSEEARGYVVDLTKAIEDEKAAAVKPPPEVKPPPTEVKPPPAEVIPAPGPEVTDSPAPARGGRGLRIAGIVTLGVGVACVVGGVVFGMQAKSKSDSASSRTTPWDPSIESDGKAAQRNMYILVGVGSAAIIGGGVMWLLGHRAGKREAVALTPVVTPTSTALVLGARF